MKTNWESLPRLVDGEGNVFVRGDLHIDCGGRVGERELSLPGTLKVTGNVTLDRVTTIKAAVIEIGGDLSGERAPYCGVEADLIAVGGRVVVGSIETRGLFKAGKTVNALYLECGAALVGGDVSVYYHIRCGGALTALGEVASSRIRVDGDLLAKSVRSHVDRWTPLSPDSPADRITVGGNVTAEQVLTMSGCIEVKGDLSVERLTARVLRVGGTVHAQKVSADEFQGLWLCSPPDLRRAIPVLDGNGDLWIAVEGEKVGFIDLSRSRVENCISIISVPPGTLEKVVKGSNVAAGGISFFNEEDTVRIVFAIRPPQPWLTPSPFPAEWKVKTADLMAHI